MKYSVCIEMLFPESDFPDRIRKVKEAGIPAVEFWCWWEHDIGEIAEICRKEGIAVAGICTRFLSMTDEEQGEAYLEALRETLAAARILRCQHIVSHVGYDNGQAYEKQRGNILRTLRKAAADLEGAEIPLLLEPVSREEIPNYFESRSDGVAEMIRATDSPYVRMLFDIYHQQLTEGNILGHLRRHRELIGHIHAAGVPERGEIERSELWYPRVFEELEAIGYDGYIGLEYHPAGNTEEGLRRLPDLAGPWK